MGTRQILKRVATLEKVHSENETMASCWRITEIVELLDTKHTT